MNISQKKRLLAYLLSHDDSSDEARELIGLLNSQVNYADCDIYSVCVEDLLQLNGERKERLEKLFGKAIGAFTAEDCQAIADEIADNEGENFGEVLYNALSTIEETLS